MSKKYAKDVKNLGAGGSFDLGSIKRSLLAIFVYWHRSFCESSEYLTILYDQKPGDVCDNNRRHQRHETATVDALFILHEALQEKEG